MAAAEWQAAPRSGNTITADPGPAGDVIMEGMAAAIIDSRSAGEGEY